MFLELARKSSIIMCSVIEVFLKVLPATKRIAIIRKIQDSFGRDDIKVEVSVVMGRKQDIKSMVSLPLFYREVEEQKWRNNINRNLKVDTFAGMNYVDVLMSPIFMI